MHRPGRGGQHQAGRARQRKQGLGRQGGRIQGPKGTPKISFEVLVWFFIFIILVTTIKCAVVVLDQKSLIKKWKARNYDN